MDWVKLLELVRNSDWRKATDSVRAAARDSALWMALGLEKARDLVQDLVLVMDSETARDWTRAEVPEMRRVWAPVMVKMQMLMSRSDQMRRLDLEKGLLKMTAKVMDLVRIRDSEMATRLRPPMGY